MHKIFLILILIKVFNSSFKNPYRTKLTNIVAMKIQIGQTLIEKPIIIGLFGREVPMAAENFYKLCVGTTYKNGKALTYKNTKFHRASRELMIEGGDILGSGNGGMSIWGSDFIDENFNVKHDIGTVSFSNTGKNSNNSRFFISTVKMDMFNGKNVVFGLVIYGMETVYLIEALDDGSGRPISDVVILDCYDPTANFFF